MNRLLKQALAMVFSIGLLAVLPAGTAFSASSGDSGPGSGPGSSPGSDNMPVPASKPPKCPPGQVWDPEAKRLFGKGRCVTQATMNENGSDIQELTYAYGKARADDGDFEHAIEVLSMAPDQNDARVLNMLGYSSRKLGRMDEALVFYKAAIATNPDFSLVREYLGEAYIQLGLLEKAREQLTEIERICGGRQCGEYNQLAELIVDSQLAH